MCIYQMHPSNAFAKAWAYCNETTQQGYKDITLKQRYPEADSVCRLPTGKDAGLKLKKNTLRCLKDQKRSCVIGEGGVAEEFGDHDVPDKAWYIITGNEEFPDVRCQCGCFSGSMKVLTSLGEQQFKLLYGLENEASFSLQVYDASSRKFKYSHRMSNLNVLAGPENKPMILLGTLNGISIELTDSHPVVILRNDEKIIVRAAEVELSDKLIDQQDIPLDIAFKDSFSLPDDDNYVYNIDTGFTSNKDHIIIVNGLQMGDLFIQNHLSESESRAQNFL